MKTATITFLTVVTFFLAGHSTVWATAEWQVLQSLRLETKPVDVAVAADNRWLYLLNDQGKVLIYGFDGQLKDTIDVGPGIDQIKAGPREDLLFLLSRSGGSVQLISISLIEEINIEQAPFKGSENAPITVAVFSDFQ